MLLILNSQQINFIYLYLHVWTVGAIIYPLYIQTNGCHVQEPQNQNALI